MVTCTERRDALGRLVYDGLNIVQDCICSQYSDRWVSLNPMASSSDAAPALVRVASGDASGKGGLVRLNVNGRYLRFYAGFPDGVETVSYLST